MEPAAEGECVRREDVTELITQTARKGSKRKKDEIANKSVADMKTACKGEVAQLKYKTREENETKQG